MATKVLKKPVEEKAIKLPSNKITPELKEMLAKNDKGIFLDVGCGNDKMPGFVGMDYFPYPNVDVVWNLEQFPYPLPDESCGAVFASHIIEHLNPHGLDPRFVALVNLMVQKGLLSQEEIDTFVGEVDYQPVFLRFMDEIWRILKPGAEFMMAFPYGGSTGYWQDPTHCNGVNEITFAYFDPLEPNTNGQLYRLYKPKPWKIKYSTWNPSGNMEIALIKRKEDPSYYE